MESLHIFEEENCLGKIATLSQQLRRELMEDLALNAHPAVAGVRVLGATAVIEAPLTSGFRHQYWLHCELL